MAAQLRCTPIFFHQVLGIAQAGGVADVQRHAVDLDVAAQGVARGAGDGGDDGQLGAGQRIEQRALAHIGLAGQHHLESFAQQRALARALQHLFEALQQRRQLALHVGLLHEFDVFLLGEVERRLDEQAQLNERVAELGHFTRQRAIERASGAARGALGAGVDQVGHRLGLRQVELAVEEGALRELAGLGRSRPGQQVEAARQQQLQHHRSAMRLQLQHMLAGVAVRGREVQRQAMVDGTAVGRQEGGRSGRGAV
jgi:hypothetical protein